MPVNNVFQMLAQQEIDRPQRELQMMQVQAQKAKLSQMMQEQAYQQKAQTDLAAMPQSTQTTTTLGSMAPQGQPFNPVDTPPQANMDPNAQGNSLAAMGLNVNPMQKTEQKPLTLLEGFQREYNYHNANGRRDMAKQVLKDQFDYTIQVADFVDKLRKQPGGAETVTAWMKANPDVSSVLGEPSTIKVRKEGVWYPVTKDDSNDIIPGKFWSYDGKGGINQHEVKPETVQTFAPGVGIPDGKGGYTVPVPKEEKPEYKSRERKDGRRILFEESQDNGKTWKRVSESPIDKPQSVGGVGGNSGTRGSGGSVPTGKPPAGYRYTANGDLEPIPGGPAAQKADETRRSIESSKAAIDLSITTVDNLKNHKGRKLATGKSRMTGAHKIPGTDAYDFDRELESFDAQLFLSNISSMKGMGALSNAEGAKVSAAAGAIKAGMSEPAFLNNINVIQDTLRLAKRRIDTGRLLGADGNGNTNRTPAKTATGKPAPKLSKAAQSIADRW